MGTAGKGDGGNARADVPLQSFGARVADPAQLADALHQAPVAIGILRGRTAAEFVFQFTNPRYLETVGRDTVALGRRMLDALPELDDALLAVMQGVLDTKRPFAADAYLVPLDRDGDGTPEDYYFNMVFHPLIDSDGSAGGLIVVGTEVTEQVRARKALEEANEQLQAQQMELEITNQQLQENAVEMETQAEELERANTHLEESEAKLTFALDVADLGAWDLELATQTAWRSLQHDQIFGYPGGLSEWTYEMFLQHVVPEDRERVAEAFGSALRDVTAWDFTCRIRRAGDGAERWISARGEPIRNAAGEPVRIVGVVKDITEEHEAEAALVAAKRDAEAANRAKSEFLAVMSHELRTPLNAIGGYAELMEMEIHGALTEEQRNAIGRIQKSQRHLLGLINGVLNYSKVEGGHVRYDVTDVAVDEVLATCEALVAPQARAKGVALTLSGCDERVMARADRDKVQQVVLNLLTNAIKFTEAGGTVSLWCGGADGNTVEVKVRDTGRGIGAADLEHIFQPFVQVDATLTRTHEGTGLGLAISRDLARGMGGEITVESEVGVGSTFTLRLPGVAAMSP